MWLRAHARSPRPRTCLGRSRRSLWVATIALLAAALPAFATKQCDKVYHVRGRILDASDRPVSDASVFLLLDEISQKKFAREGVRAVRARSLDGGRFTRTVTCGSSPDPCGKKPKTVTVFVEARGARTKLRGFPMKDLELQVAEDGCHLELPPIRLAVP